MKENKKLPPEERIEPPDIPRGNGLTRKEAKKKREIIAEGFTSWTRADFENFIACNAAYGRSNVHLIATTVAGKKEDEVQRYYDVFWERYEEIDDYQIYL